MRVSDRLGSEGVWFHIDSDHHVMALIGKGTSHFHHLAFDTVDIGQMRDLLDRLAPPRPLARLGAGAPRRRRQHRELRPHRRGGVLRRAVLRHGAAPERPRAARLARRPLLLEHLGAAAAPLLLPLRRRRDRVGAGEPRAARPAAAGRDAGRIDDPAATPRRSRREGRASLVPRPPWHYVGDFLVIEFWAEPAAVAALLPPGLAPHPTPAAARPSSPTGSPARRAARSCVDPSRSQYREFFVVVQRPARRRGGDDLPVHLGRPRLRARPRLDPGLSEEARLDLDHPPFRSRLPADPGLRPGATYGGDLLGRGAAARRGDGHARARSPRTGRPTTRRRSQRPPFARLEAGRHDEPAVHELVRSRSRDRVVSEVWEGTATLELLAGSGRGARRARARCASGKGFRFSFAYTVDDLETVGALMSATRGTRDGRRASRSRPTTSSTASASASAERFDDVSPIDERRSPRSRAAARPRPMLAVEAAERAFPGWAALGRGRPRRATCAGSPT